MPLALDHARTIVHAVGMALAHAHSHGIVHGDITPQNIFLVRDGDVRILDFGASRRLQGEPPTADGVGADDARIPPRLAATRRYASCEVLEGCTAEMSDDLFGLASVAYVLLTGDHPFGNRNAIEARADGRKPVRPRGLSARQWRILRQGLDLRRDRRPSDVGRWVRRLNSGASIRPLPVLCDLFAVRIVRHGKRTAAAVAVALGLLTAGGYGWHAHEDSLRSFAATVRAEAAATLVTAQDRVRALLE
jgi:serine/threonine protein kinase